MKKLKVPVIYSQRSGEWGNITLGYNLPTAKDSAGNLFNIYWYGCLITCYGMYIGKKPNEVNQILKDNEGYTDKSGNFIWSKATVLGLEPTYTSPTYDGPVTQQGLDKIKEFIDNGYPLITRIDFNPSTNGEEMHFVLIYGYDGDTIFIADPWTGTETSLDVYGGAKRAVIQFKAYDKKLSEGDIPAPSIDPIIIQQSDNWIAFITHAKLENNKDIVIGEWDKYVGYADVVRDQTKLLEIKDRQLGELQIKVEENQKSLLVIAKDLEDLQANYTASQSTIEELKLKIKRLQSDNEDLKEIAKPIEQITCKQHLSMAWKKLFK